MIRKIYACEAHQHYELLDSMFRHRANQFKHRLNWDVQVDECGYERDEYDDCNPLYLVLETENGQHQGSLRLLPTMGDTMVNDHFNELTGGVQIRSPFIWECTRFCLAPNAPKNTSQALAQAAIQFGQQCHINFYIGVFERRMIEVYRRIGWEPELLGAGGSARKSPCAGIWKVPHSWSLYFNTKINNDLESSHESYGAYDRKQEELIVAEKFYLSWRRAS